MDMDTSHTETLSLSQSAAKLENLKDSATLAQSLEYTTFQKLLEIETVFTETEHCACNEWLLAYESLFEILNTLFLSSDSFNRLGHYFLIDQLIEEGNVDKLAKRLLSSSKPITIRVNTPLSASRGGFIAHYLTVAEEAATCSGEMQSAAKQLVSSFNIMWHTLSTYMEHASSALHEVTEAGPFRDTLISFGSDETLLSQYKTFAGNWQSFAHQYLLSRL